MRLGNGKNHLFEKNRRCGKRGEAGREGAANIKNVLWNGVRDGVRNDARRDEKCGGRFMKRPPRGRKGYKFRKKFKTVCKPSSVVYGHLSTPAVTDGLQRYSRIFPDGQPCVGISQSCIGRGLHGSGRYRPDGELLPRLSILTVQSTAVYFCCTFLEVAFTCR